MQPIEELEKSYLTPDPWGFQSNPEDAKRKEKVIDACRRANRNKLYKIALEIGAGEGWITKDLPARKKHGYEISKNARARFPRSVTAVTSPKGGYDLVVACGILYAQYDHELFFTMLREQSTKIIVTSHIKTDELTCMSDVDFHQSTLEAYQIYEDEFPYREFTQVLRVFKKL